MIPNPIVVPVTLSTTETTVPVQLAVSGESVPVDAGHVVAPVQIDFTASVETLEPGEDATVDYDNKHFSFGIPKGEKGDQGDRGYPGADGAPGEPGQPGRDGIDGFSPVATVSKSGNTATITITDKNGTTTTTVKDGTDGTDGHDGTDGYSPSATVTKAGGVVTISITDKDGTTTETVNDIATYAGSATAAGNATMTNGILYGQVASTSTSTSFTATVSGVTSYYDGLAVMLRNGIVTSASGCTLDINGLGGKPIYSSMEDATRDTTIFNIKYTMLFVYDSTRVEGGCWICYRGYNSDTNTIGYILRTNYSGLPMSDKVYRYRLCFTSADGSKYVPSNTSTSTNATAARAVNQRPIDPFGKIVYYAYTTAIDAGSRLGTSYQQQQGTLVLGYSFNVAGNETITEWKPCYLKCAPQSDGSAIMDSTTPIVQSLPSTEDGKIYIFLGIAYDTTHMELHMTHPIYEYKNNAIREWTNAYASGGGSGTVTSVGISNSGGLSVSGSPVTTSGTISIGHSNTVTAQTTQAVYPIKIDANGHISEYGTAVTIPTVPSNVSAFNNDAGYLTLSTLPIYNGGYS